MEISLRQIAYFLRLVERRSFTTAANDLGITQPALSIAISQLEKALGVILIERSSLPVALTEFGQTFHRYALRVHRNLQEARDELAALNSGELGRLDICMGPSAAAVEVASVLTSMVSDFPHLEIHVRAGVFPAVADPLKNGEFSVFVGTVGGDFADPQLTVTPLSDIPFVVVAGATHPLADRQEVSPADLLECPWLAIGSLDVNLPNWKTAFLAEGLEPPRPAIDVRNLALVRILLNQGRFVTVLPTPMVAADLEAGVLVSVHPASFDWRLQLHAVTRAGLNLPAAARIFLQRLTSSFGQGATPLASINAPNGEVNIIN